MKITKARAIEYCKQYRHKPYAYFNLLVGGEIIKIVKWEVAKAVLENHLLMATLFKRSFE